MSDNLRFTVQVLHDLRPELTRIDEKIFRLLEERCQLIWNARRESVPYDKEYDMELLDLWLEEGIECGMDEVTLIKLCKCIEHLCQKPGE